MRVVTGMIRHWDKSTAVAGLRRHGHDAPAGTWLHLLAVALASGALCAVLGLTAVRAAHALAQTPAAWWGMSQLGSAVVCLASGAGALGALWHMVSAAVAAALLPHGRQARTGASGARGAALALLDRWGAPMVRRIAAGALIVGLGSSPAMAAADPQAGDDLGWQPTVSATQDPSADGGRSGPQEAPPAPPGLPSPQPQAPQPQSPQAPAPEPPAPEDQAPDSPGTAGPASPQQRAGATTPAPPVTPSPSDPQPPAPQGLEPGDSGTGSPADRAPDGSTTGRHVVVRGESLWSITAGLLPQDAGNAGIARAWPVLYRANAQTIGPDPSLITPGTVLTIPADLPGLEPAAGAQPG
ncbi:peptidoglycan-binding protein LysM [Actinomyces bowdenii]|uniref:peptidoglycan-binding protein LysM n=1 Tax=Actinomyces bowdenii TaxID=131109 RepID=UPI00214C71EF|nr:peptidoglycan-binding protein LysM [Actinomyces bowdenii]MCR2052372.1 peptidoglycan-binding protein LysM [Actinomyces bowdenii]